MFGISWRPRGRKSEASDLAPRTEGRVVHIVGGNPDGEAFRTFAMGRTIVKVLDRKVYERACAAANVELRAARLRHEATVSAGAGQAAQ